MEQVRELRGEAGWEGAGATVIDSAEGRIAGALAPQGK